MMRKMGSVRKNFSANPGDYKLLEEVGYGASATVFRAIYLPSNEVIAVKCLDLDRCNSNLDDIRKEAQTMILIDHPNVIKAFCSFVVEQCLWVVMPFMAEGSCLHLMKIAYPDGFEEFVIATILKETLKALEYLHRHGHIHRDIKAGNILLDSDGIVKLGDFGVSACMFDKGDRQRSRNTFVGTPCWMAPEVLQPGSGYDFKADIWSFGITALELAHGHAPFSKYPPMKVLLMTIQNAPPGLDYDRDKKFSKSFKEMVAMCLVKDQTKRPTAEKLLKHSFFKHAKPPELSVKNLLKDLPPLWDRVKALQLKDAAQLALKKMPSAEQEAISQSEYKRGVSAWNFDVEDLKAQASLVHDYDDEQGLKEEDEPMDLFSNHKHASSSKSNFANSSPNRSVLRGSVSSAELSQYESSNGKGVTVEPNCNNGSQEKFDLCEKEGLGSDPALSTPDKGVVQGPPQNQTVTGRQTRSGPLIPNTVLTHSQSERGRLYEKCVAENQPVPDKGKSNVRRAPSFSGPLMLPNRASANSLSAPIWPSGGFRDEDKSKGNVVQIKKGRFSVTSESLDPGKDLPSCTVPRGSSTGSSPLRKSASVGEWLFDARPLPNNLSPKEGSNSTVPTSLLMPHLQNILQQTTIQQDLIANLLSTLQLTDVVDGGHTGNAQVQPLENNAAVDPAASERERLLLLKVSELQARMIALTDELTSEKLKHLQLKQQLSHMSGREEGSSRKGERDS
ncbi:hypothetical protein MKW98_001690 [Papaver atlanticum]|uniref:Protein kinase domain-containing protein n=1 Tax=Papaver atlanticum TaxID=357466 RepID=A0AAD4X8R9_9MAGN|nr:hypothetical protein MKW98_001690 [Papaver atlanticum]